jgi:hypothetical protein
MFRVEIKFTIFCILIDNIVEKYLFISRNKSVYYQYHVKRKEKIEWMEIDRKKKMSKTKTSKIEIIQISKARSNKNESRSK